MEGECAELQYLLIPLRSLFDFLLSFVVVVVFLRSIKKVNTVMENRWNRLSFEII